ncbi:CA2D2-like protein [Mya arenaria]|uniref:CA2D2-like protein n=1 Tax=Mya arenaria TaxID=6604 RepID=A0ABY7G0U2_MYAAR|nr:CA2D2-like protein [Mya arenaria]
MAKPGSKVYFTVCFIVFYSHCVLTDFPSRIEMEHWSDLLRRELYDLFDGATGYNTIPRAYNDESKIDRSPFQLNFQDVDPVAIVDKMAVSLSSMLENKMKALKDSVEKAERAAKGHVWSNDITKEKCLKSKEIKPDDPHKEILNGLKWSAALDEVFYENYQNDPEILWQYFGSQSGFMRTLPASRWNTGEEVDLYDVRRRPWYTQGSSSPKDMLILIDTSGSVQGQALELMKVAVKSLLDTLGENDFVNIVQKLIEEVDNVQAIGMADFGAGFRFAFEQFDKLKNQTAGERGAECNRMIMLLTDGGTDEAQEANQTILGVMGIDVTIDSMLKRAPLRMSEMKEPPNVDILELEVDTPKIRQLRRRMIDRETDTVAFDTYTLSLDKRHVDKEKDDRQRTYSFRPIDNTSFSFVGAFLSTMGGLTAVYPKSDELLELFMKERDTWKANYFKRAIDTDSLMFSAPYILVPKKDGNDSVGNVMISKSVSINNSDLNSKLQGQKLNYKAAVYGVVFSHQTVLEGLKKRVQVCVQSDVTACHLLDDGAFLVATNQHNFNTSVGMFFGKVDPEVMSMLYNESFFSRLDQYEFGTSCKLPNDSTTSTGTLAFRIPSLNLLYEFLTFNWWSSVVTCLLNPSPAAVVEASSDDDEEPCSKKQAQYYYSDDTWMSGRTWECDVRGLNCSRRMQQSVEDR